MAGTKLPGVRGEVYNGATKILGITNYDPNGNTNEIDGSDHDSGEWGETMTGTKKMTVSITARYLDGDSGQAAMYNAWIANTVLPIMLRPNGTGTGKTQWSGDFRVTSWKGPSAPQDGVQEISFDLSSAGAVTLGTQS